MTPLEKLTAIFASLEFSAQADKHNMLGSLGGYDMTEEMVLFSRWACDMYHLKADIVPQGVVLSCIGSRAKRPPCLTISPQQGHAHSPSCIAVRFTGSATIQLFEGDADDTGLGSGGEGSYGRIETQGRMLLC